ncbi:MAG TPA: hypothetical protein VFO39_06360 [Candidatus Sulfotelmatobacter sp.]|nr:hypothetical protein [Candidatus Sulfotelmatobacter sp.]
MKLSFCPIALLLASLAVAQNPSDSPAQAREGTCGPPSYCARTDRRLETYPEQPPALGPAGSIIVDPNFGSRILRVTDANSDPVQPGRSLFSPSSAEQTAWNKNSTMFYVTTSGGTFLLYAFDPTKMAARQAKTPRLPWGPEPQFSFSQPNILYGLNGRAVTFEQYDAANGRVTEVNSPAKCIKLAADDKISGITVSADDNRFMAMLGPRQDDFRILYVYDRKLGCRWYNTQTGEIGGDWGPKGTVSIPDRFPMHNARMAKSGKFLYTTRGVAGPPGRRWIVWEIDTLNAGVCTKACSGHHVLGYSHIIGPAGMNHPLDLSVKPLDNLDSTTPLIKDLSPVKGSWYDSHFSWSNVSPDDSEPVCFSTYQPKNPENPVAPLLVAGPWENEIDCAETDGRTLKVWRFAHTYSTARNGFWSTPRGNVSQDGRFFMFTSDWQDQLGKPPNGSQYRTDVFIVELR